MSARTTSTARPKDEVKIEPDEAPTPETSALEDIDRLDPQPVEMVLCSGTQFEVEPLKLRQFLALLRILTRGASTSLGALSGMAGQEFTTQFIAVIAFAIPEAENETVDFLKAITRPAGLTGDAIKDGEKRLALYTELENPDIEDALIIIQALVEQEGDDLRGLGNRLRSMMGTAQKMGLVPKDVPPVTAA